jgi:predicted thioesterase
MITQLVTLRGNKMELQIGLSSEKEMIVTESDLASVSGNIGAEVLSTHCLVLLMELAARQVVEDRIPKDKITLGTHVDIRHFSAALVGSRVRAVVIVSRNLFLKKLRCKTLSKQQSDRQ